LPANVAYQIFQTVQFQLVNLFELLAEQSFRETFRFIPNDIMFGQVNQVTAFVLAEWHFGVRKLEQELLLVHLKFEYQHGNPGHDRKTNHNKSNGKNTASVLAVILGETVDDLAIGQRFLAKQMPPDQ
jgi:hypothetical protein